jgi:hypothetical protein
LGSFFDLRPHPGDGTGDAQGSQAATQEQGGQRSTGQAGLRGKEGNEKRNDREKHDVKCQQQVGRLE